MCETKFSIPSDDTSFNIVNFIETNPNSQLTNTYNNQFLERIKTEFTEFQQQLFISFFYCSLNYNKTTDFVINLDNIWQWLGFSTKQNARILLEKNFTTKKDYIFKIKNKDKKKEQRGGHNKETILLNIHTFKLLCIKAATSKANEIHEYFVKLEELLHEVIKEESEELKKQL